MVDHRLVLALVAGMIVVGCGPVREPEAAPPVPRPRKIRFEVTPASATVKVNGQLLKTRTVHLSPSGKGHKILIEARGYKPYEALITAESRMAFKVRLERDRKHVIHPGLIKKSTPNSISSIFGRDSAPGTDARSALTGRKPVLGLLGGGSKSGVGRLTVRGRSGSGGGLVIGGRGGYRRTRAPRVLVGRLQVRGSLDMGLIRRVVRRHINEIKYCYHKNLSARPRLYGRLVVSFTIAASGRVVHSRLSSSTLAHRPTESCIVRATRRWLFPKPAGGGVVIVALPMILRTY